MRQQGHTCHHERLTTLCQQLDAVEHELARFQTIKEQLREEIAGIVAALGGKAELGGFGRLELTAAGTCISYNRQGLDALIMRLVAEGQNDLANTISQYRKESTRAGSLRIVRESSRAQQGKGGDLQGGITESSIID